MNFTANDLARVCGATVLNATKYVDHLNAAMAYFEINNLARVSKFMAQISWESTHLSHTEENLNYSAKRLMVVWPQRFPTLDSTKGFARNPQALAEKVYGGRLGNRDAGDGWRYRGRGLKQLTGRANYEAAEDGLGMFLTGDNASRVAQPEAAAWTACWFWYVNQCNDIADSGDFEALTRVINGGLNGHEDRVDLLGYCEAKLALCWNEVSV